MGLAGLAAAVASSDARRTPSTGSPPRANARFSCYLDHMEALIAATRA